MDRGDYRLLPKGLRRMLVFSETFFFREYGKAKTPKKTPAGGGSQDLLLAGFLRVGATGTISGMPTGQASRASVLTNACLRASGASPRHSAILRA
jgi:hypothetical protein